MTGSHQSPKDTRPSPKKNLLFFQAPLRRFEIHMTLSFEGGPLPQKFPEVFHPPTPQPNPTQPNPDPTFYQVFNMQTATKSPEQHSCCHNPRCFQGRLLDAVPAMLSSLCAENRKQAGHLNRIKIVQHQAAIGQALTDYTSLPHDELLSKLCASVQREAILLSGHRAGEHIQDFFFQGFWFGSMAALKILDDGQIKRCDREICEYMGEERCPLNLGTDMTWHLEELASHPEFSGGLGEGILSAWRGHDTGIHELCHLSTEAFRSVREFSRSLETRIPEIMDRGMNVMFDERFGSPGQLETDRKTTQANCAPREASSAVPATRKCSSCKADLPKSRFSSSQLKKKAKARCSTCVNIDQFEPSNPKQPSKVAPKEAKVTEVPALTPPEDTPPEDTPPPLPVCSICMENVKTHAFLPCGHMMSCGGCSELVMKTSKTCPVCRSPAKMAMRIYAM